MLGELISMSILFLQDSRLLSPSNIFINGHMAIKNVTSQASKENTGSLSYRSHHIGTIAKRWVYGIEMRGTRKARTVVIVR